MRKKATSRRTAKKAQKRASTSASGKTKGQLYTEFATALLKKDKTTTTKDILAAGRKKGLKVTPNQVSAVRKTLGISTGKGRKAGSRRAGRKTTRASAGNVDSYLQDAVVEAIKSAQYEKARNILGVLEKS